MKRGILYCVKLSRLYFMLLIIEMVILLHLDLSAIHTSCSELR